MKKIIVGLLLILCLSLVTPAYAGGKQTVGERLNIYLSGDQTFPAGEPFFIRHGWQLGAPSPHIGVYEFVLDVDGAAIPADYRSVTVDPAGDPITKTVVWIFNFPDGMTGTHTFNGHWMVPCDAVYGDDCENPVELIETWSSTVVVTFEE